MRSGPTAEEESRRTFFFALVFSAASVLVAIASWLHLLADSCHWSYLTPRLHQTEAAALRNHLPFSPIFSRISALPPFLIFYKFSLSFLSSSPCNEFSKMSLSYLISWCHTSLIVFSRCFSAMLATWLSGCWLVSGSVGHPLSSKLKYFNNCWIDYQKNSLCNNNKNNNIALFQ